MLKNIPKPVAIGIALVAVVAAVASAMFFMKPTEAGGKVDEKVYPNAGQGPGVEQFGAEAGGRTEPPPSLFGSGK